MKIAPAYGHEVVHVKDASRCVPVCERLIDPRKRKAFDAENRQYQAQMAAAYRSRQDMKLVPFREAQENRFQTDWAALEIPKPSFLGVRTLTSSPLPSGEGPGVSAEAISLEELAKYIDWSPFFWAWELRGKFPDILQHPQRGEEATKLYDDGRKLLDAIIENRWLTANGVYGFWPAASVGEDILVYEDESRTNEIARFHFLRQQWLSEERDRYYCLADFIAPVESGRQDYLGGFAVTGGIGTDELVKRFEADNDDYSAIMAKVLPTGWPRRLPSGCTRSRGSNGASAARKISPSPT